MAWRLTRTFCSRCVRLRRRQRSIRCRSLPVWDELALHHGRGSVEGGLGPCVPLLALVGIRLDHVWRDGATEHRGLVQMNVLEV